MSTSTIDAGREYGRISTVDVPVLDVSPPVVTTPNGECITAAGFQQALQKLSRRLEDAARSGKVRQAHGKLSAVAPPAVNKGREQASEIVSKNRE